MNEPTVEQTHQAFASRLAEARNSKLALASAVRDCCRDLPLREILAVAGRKLRWIEAFCAVWGGRDWQREDTHTQHVLTLDGCILQEPRFIVTRPDWADRHRSEGDWVGPEGGWYSVAAQQRYERLCDAYEDCDLSSEKPAALRVCGKAELSAVAKFLPAALAAWHDQRRSEYSDRLKAVASVGG